ncbi:hypothetical protein CRUP_013995 [Coryphaenoides rupestris]|nr:hypothetical protein CRUP_013995 [Coryphaenoides rupestris]
MVVKCARAKRTKVTLKMAKKALKVTAEGRQRLDLSNLGIAAFPKCLAEMAANVEELDLSRNALCKLPAAVGELTSLRWLDLHSNKLQALPEALGKLVALTHLNVSNNRLRSAGLPAALGLLAGLQSLNLGLNQLDSLPPAMEALTGLQEVGLFDNLFTQLPAFVAAVGRLNAKRNPCTDGRGAEAETGTERPRIRAKTLHLVPESSLCEDCLHRCTQDRGNTRGDGGRPGASTSEEEEERRATSYSELTTPNSIAAANQDAWRLRGQTPPTGPESH